MGFLETREYHESCQCQRVLAPVWGTNFRPFCLRGDGGEQAQALLLQEGAGEGAPLGNCVAGPGRFLVTDGLATGHFGLAVSPHVAAPVRLMSALPASPVRSPGGWS